MTKKKLNVYLAGPDVFFPAAAECGKYKKNILKNYDLIGHYPLDNELTYSLEDMVEFAYAIAKANEALIQKSEIILANLDPWHGPGADNGTAFEMGYMSAKADIDPDNTMIIGYYSNGIPDNFEDRVSAQVYAGKVHSDTSGSLLSEDGFTIESFGLQDNLMLITAIHKTGGKIFGSFEEAASKVHDLWQQKKKVTKPQFTPMFSQKALMIGATLTLSMACTAAAIAWSRPSLRS